jgi:two-component system, sensor histidine kinase and response regulator
MQGTNPDQKILVIDDNASNLLLVRSILKKSHPNYQILTSLSGEEGIEIAQAQIPQAILLDIFMPNMDGYETCRILKSYRETCNIPVLMISADGQNAETRLGGLKAGADAIMSKPFKQEEFIAIVNIMLRIKRVEDTLIKQNQELQNSLIKEQSYQVKLKRLNSELSIIEERERHKIAEFLHDGISQVLSLANLKLSSVQTSDQNIKMHKTICESIELINAAISQTRSLTYDLSPPILYELGLIPAIKWKLDQIQNKYGISAILKSKVAKIEINSDIRILIFRIISELINNVIKHADANSIEIDVSVKQKILYISVVDNGKGFNFRKTTKSTDQSGFGLFSIRERLDSIQGNLYFESDMLVGTKAVVQIPV